MKSGFRGYREGEGVTQVLRKEMPDQWITEAEKAN